jgi:hypothetical protein
MAFSLAPSSRSRFPIPTTLKEGPVLLQFQGYRRESGAAHCACRSGASFYRPVDRSSAQCRAPHPEPLQDEAFVLFLLDTGSQHCTVLSKGNKRRVVYCGRATRSRHLALPAGNAVLRVICFRYYLLKHLSRLLSKVQSGGVQIAKTQ